MCYNKYVEREKGVEPIGLSPGNALVSGRGVTLIREPDALTTLWYSEA